MAAIERQVSRFGVGLIVAVIFFLVLSVALYSFTKQSVEHEVHANQLAELEAKKQLIVARFNEGYKEVVFLSKVPPVDGIIRATKNQGVDPYDKTSLDEWKRRLETIFHAYIQSHPSIRQIRYIGYANDGLELVRVEREQGAIVIVPERKLQAKGNRSYFKEIAELDTNSLYISDLELNKEHGKIQYPAWPTYRVAMNIVDESLQPFGFVIINYDATDLLDSIDDSEQGYFTYLLNNNEQFLLHHMPEWGFAFEEHDRAGWGDYFSNALVMDSTQFSTTVSPTGVVKRYSSTRLNGRYAGGKPLILVESIPQNSLNKIVFDRYITGQIVLLAAFSIAFTVIYFYHRALMEGVNRSRLTKKYQAIFTGARDAILIFDGKRKLVDANTAALQLFDLSPTALYEASFSHLFGDDASTVRDLLAISQAGAFTSEQEMTIGTAENARIITIAFSQIEADKKADYHYVCIACDVTDEREASQLIASTNERLQIEVEARTQELEAAVDRAELATKTKSQFLASMSHEIRTPMNGVFGMLNLMRRDPLSKRQLRNLEMAEASVRSLTELVNDILDISKIEAGKLDIETAQFDLCKLLHSCATSCSILLADKPVLFLVDISDIEHGWVLADSNRIRQIINNLLGNAIKFTSFGEVRLYASTRKEEDGSITLYCSVSDTGVGISSEKLPTLFSAFVQEDIATARNYGGTGLGLSICKQLCDLMGGSIEAKSVKGMGSMFSFTLPLQLPSNSTRDVSLHSAEPTRVALALDVESLLSVVNKVFNTFGHQVEELTFDQLIRDLSGHALDDFYVVAADSRMYQKYAAQFEKYRAMRETPLLLLLVNQEYQTKDNDLDASKLPAHTLVLETPVSLVSIAAGLNAMDSDRFWFESQRVGADATERPSYDLTGKSMLVVDDHHINREVMRGILEDCGALVVDAKDGQEALDILSLHEHNDPFDLVFMDCQMPVMDGYQATRAIRESVAGAGNKDIPIVAVTAAAMSNERKRCFDVGMDDYLSKPVDPVNLYAVLKKWVPDNVLASTDDAVDYVVKEESATEPVAPLKHEQQEGNELLWDRDGALARLGGRENLFARVATIYLETSPQVVSDLNEAVVDDNGVAIKSAAHSLKGISASIGAMRVAAYARKMEELLESGTVAERAAVMEKLNTHYHEVMALLSAQGLSSMEALD